MTAYPPIRLSKTLWLEYQEPRSISPLTVRSSKEGPPCDLGELKLAPAPVEHWLWCFYPRDCVGISCNEMSHLANFIAERNRAIEDLEEDDDYGDDYSW